MVTEPPLPAEALGTEPPAIADLPIDPELQESPEEDDGHRRTALPKPQRMSKTSGVPERPTGIRPPRLRPPVIRPPVIRPPAASTELPKFDASEEPHDLTRTAVAIDPQLLANLDDLDDDY